MKFTKSLATAISTTSLLLASGAASAGIVNIGGVFIDTGTGLNSFSANSALVENVVNVVGEEISGYGLITNISGAFQDTFCPGCELSYVFSGYKLVDGFNVSVPTTDPAYDPFFSFSGGVIDFYVSARNANYNVVGTFTDGLKWMSLVGADPLSLGTLTGNINGVSTISPFLAGVGTGYLDVVLGSGVAADYFNTNGQVGGTDFLYTSSFQPNAITYPGGKNYQGSADISGNVQDIPEPGVLALLGLGFAAIAVSKGRKKLG